RLHPAGAARRFSPLPPHRARFRRRNLRFPAFRGRDWRGGDLREGGGLVYGSLAIGAEHLAPVRDACSDYSKFHPVFRPAPAACAQKFLVSGSSSVMYLARGFRGATGPLAQLAEQVTLNH